MENEWPMNGRFFISACKGRPAPHGLSKAGPSRVFGKIFRAALAVFSRKALHNPARDGKAGKK
ncbi:hypothetical protein NXW08_14015 [Bacteroides uniformis]|uniref:hypothetical protein n=1 Tax=Bacteroides uniformis TaxID=820 RepID=UPI002166BB78|nr:hypothetical protein [Bacteroides uniformis]MCS2724486.1 hypothetical protein [Bacteroides uniformis]